MSTPSSCIARTSIVPVTARPERRGVEVGAAAAADVEGAAGQRGEALLDQREPAVDGAGDLGAVLRSPDRGRRRCRARRTGRCRRCRCTGWRPCPASRRRRRRCRARRRTRCRRARRREGRSGPCSRGVPLWWVRCRSRPGARKRLASAGPPVGFAADNEDGVVAGDGAKDVGISAWSNSGGEELRGTRRRAQHDQVGAGVGADQQLAEQPGQPLASLPPLVGRARACGRRPRRDGVDQRAAGRATLTASSSTRSREQRGLGDDDALAGQQRRPARPASGLWWVSRSMICCWRAFLVRRAQALASCAALRLLQQPGRGGPSGRAAGSRPRPRRRSADRR